MKHIKYMSKAEFIIQLLKLVFGIIALALILGIYLKI